MLTKLNFGLDPQLNSLSIDLLLSIGHLPTFLFMLVCFAPIS